MWDCFHIPMYLLIHKPKQEGKNWCITLPYVKAFIFSQKRVLFIISKRLGGTCPQFTPVPIPMHWILGITECTLRLIHPTSSYMFPCVLHPLGTSERTETIFHTVVGIQGCTICWASFCFLTSCQPFWKVLTLLWLKVPSKELLKLMKSFNGWCTSTLTGTSSESFNNIFHRAKKTN